MHTRPTLTMRLRISLTGQIGETFDFTLAQFTKQQLVLSINKSNRSLELDLTNLNLYFLSRYNRLALYSYLYFSLNSYGYQPSEYVGTGEVPYGSEGMPFGPTGPALEAATGEGRTPSPRTRTPPFGKRI